MHRDKKAKLGHADSTIIVERLESCRCLWRQAITGVGEITAYATSSGIVTFLDFERGGWTMLTECPSNSIADNAAELSSMIANCTNLRL